MSVIYKEYMKDKTPEETVSFIKGILGAMGIELVEEWVEHDELEVDSLRLYIKGTKLGSNGKGVNKDYARASAYSELMERYQNMRLSMMDNQYSENERIKYYIDEEYLTADHLVSMNSAFMNMYFTSRGLSSHSDDKKAEYLMNSQRMDYNLVKRPNQFLCFPFYNMTTDWVEMMPYHIYSYYYASNGMCAGNSDEEAIVQGISEILERHVQKRIILEHPSLPDVPDSVIKSYPKVDAYYRTLCEKKDFHVMMKDCSFGGIYPVAALIIIEKNTGRYGVKLGCHPDFGVAMERAITEAAQGNNIYDYITRSRLDMLNQHVEDDTNILNGFKVGFSQFPYQIFFGDPTYDYTPVDRFKSMTNKEVLNAFINQFETMGYQILIRDVSYLGHPSFHVIIPGISEILPVTENWFKALNTKHHVSKLLMNPDNINKDNVKYIIGTMEFFANSYLENTMKSFYGGGIDGENCPGEEYGLGWMYMTSLCYYYMGNFSKAVERMSTMNRCIASEFGKTDPYYYGVMEYMKGIIKEQDHHRMIAILKVFFSEAVAWRIHTNFNDRERLFTLQYPSFAEQECEYESCDLLRYKEIMSLLKEKQSENPINQENLRRLQVWEKDCL